MSRTPRAVAEDPDVVDMLHPDILLPEPSSSPSPASELLRSAAAWELREIAYDLLGRPEHDELSLEERERLAAEVEEVVATVLVDPGSRAGAHQPGVTTLLAAELASRVEELPVHLRVTLANARRRQLLGYD